MSTDPLFTRVLVANRAEVVVRVAQTLRRMGISPAVVHTRADSGSLHRSVGDVDVEIDDYLDVDGLVAAARGAGAQAVHPGYGFLAEHAGFARACIDAGLVFIGPDPDVIALMGDKIAAKRFAADAGVPVVPWGGEAGMTDRDLAEAARQLGGPVLFKPAEGGGGKGMHRVDRLDDLDALLDVIASARRQAATAFGDDTLLVERYVSAPRHVEVQLLGDRHGAVLHLGERDCTLQRRHQKVIEETPSPLLDAASRAALCEQAVRLATACGYTGAGTVEFIVSAHSPGEAWFMEMNTRLQVEHGVTEAVSGIDLVAEQIRIAAGLPLRHTQDQVLLRGHAIEARVYAEDPARGFLPTGGTIVRFDTPDDARIDTGVAAGTAVSSSYDPMLAKVIVHARDRVGALAAMRHALERTVIHGVVTNVGFLRQLVSAPEVVADDYDTAFVEATAPSEPPLERIEALAARAIVEQAARDAGAASAPLDGAAASWSTTPRPGGGWERTDGWRHGGAAGVRVLLEDADGEAHLSTVPPDDLADGSGAAVCTVTDDAVWVTLDGDTVAVGRPGRRRAVLHDGGGSAVTSPMPGTVVAVRVAVGDPVAAGDVVAVVEAMKMEHRLVAPVDASVREVLVAEGQQVGLDDAIVVLDPAGGAT